MYHTFLATNSTRPPDWRWMRVQRTVESPSSGFQILDDQVMELGVRFWRAWSVGRNEHERARAAAKLPTVAAAYRIYEGSPSPRVGVEARILADQSPEEIAVTTGYDRWLIRLYEQLFYDVRDRLRQRDFILRQVIGLSEVAGEYEPVQVCRALSYLGGPAVVDELLLAAGTETGRPASVAEVAGWLSDAARAQLRRHVALALGRSSPVDRTVLQGFAAAFGGPRGAGRDEAADGSYDAYQMNILAMLEAMPLYVGRIEDSNSLLAEADTLATEPGTEDLVRIASGQEPQGAWRSAAETPYPEPAERDPCSG